jgi:hypothetical protein
LFNHSSETGGRINDLSGIVCPDSFGLPARDIAKGQRRHEVTQEMVQIIDRKPDFIPEADVVFFAVARPPAEGEAALAEWRCSAHAGPIVRGQVGTRSPRKDARSAFAEAVSFAHQQQIEYMVVEDPENLFPPELRLQAIAVPQPRPMPDDPPEPRRDDEDSPREARLRILAARQGLYLGNARSRDPSAADYGRYVLFADPGRAVAILGATAETRDPVDIAGAGYQGTLDEIEAFLIRGEEQARANAAAPAALAGHVQS